MKKTNHFEQFLLNINVDLFSFAFALIPDDLQAQQIVVDGIYVVVLQQREQIRSLLEEYSDNPERLQEELGVIEKSIYSNIYKISSKRFGQLKESIRHDIDYLPFYQLSMDEKALLFLKHKVKMSTDALEHIVEKDRSLIYATLGCAREKLIENLSENKAL